MRNVLQKKHIKFLKLIHFYLNGIKLYIKIKNGFNNNNFIPKKLEKKNY